MFECFGEFAMTRPLQNVKFSDAIGITVLGISSRNHSYIQNQIAPMDKKLRVFTKIKVARLEGRSAMKRNLCCLGG